MRVKHTFIKNGQKKVTQMLTPLMAIREHCLACCGWDKGEVKACFVQDCALYPFRIWIRPSRREIGNGEPTIAGEEK